MAVSNDPQLAFPYPIPEYGAEPFWQGCNEEKLLMQCCSCCQKLRWHPTPVCMHCGSDDYQWRQLSGRGKINTWTVITHPVHPAAVAKVPYVVVVVELVEQAGLTIVSNLVAHDVDDIEFDAPVKVRFEAHPNGQKLPVFCYE